MTKFKLFITLSAMLVIVWTAEIRGAGVQENITFLENLKSDNVVYQKAKNIVIVHLKTLERKPLVRELEALVSCMIADSDAHIAIRSFDDTRRTYFVKLVIWKKDGSETVLDAKVNAFGGANIEMHTFIDRESKIRKATFGALLKCKPNIDFSLYERIFGGEYVVISFADPTVEGGKVVHAPRVEIRPGGNIVPSDDFRQLAELVRQLESGLLDGETKLQKAGRGSKPETPTEGTR